MDKSSKTGKKLVVRDEKGRVMSGGGSLNPNGRPPKGQTITETFREMMNTDPLIKEALCRKVLKMALEGDLGAIKLLWSYIDGKPKQPVDVYDGRESIREMKAYINQRLSESNG